MPGQFEIINGFALTIKVPEYTVEDYVPESPPPPPPRPIETPPTNSVSFFHNNIWYSIRRS